MGQLVFVVEALTTNILPTNEATLLTFTCSESSNHENIIHEVTKYCSTTNVLPPENYPLYGSKFDNCKLCCFVVDCDYNNYNVHKALATVISLVCSSQLPIAIALV